MTELEKAARAHGDDCGSDYHEKTGHEFSFLIGARYAFEEAVEIAEEKAESESDLAGEHAIDPAEAIRYNIAVGGRAAAMSIADAIRELARVK
jgi:hypothetical protein